MGGGMRPITMDQVMCIGSEESILKCPYDGWGKHNCQHKEDVGVRCGNKNYDSYLKQVLQNDLKEVLLR